MATVAIVGGGYGGVTLAKALDDEIDVVLVEPKDAFVHTVAALRGLVDEDWSERMFVRYDNLLRRGRVVRDRVVKVDGGGSSPRTAHISPRTTWCSPAARPSRFPPRPRPTTPPNRPSRRRPPARSP